MKKLVLIFTFSLFLLGVVMRNRYLLYGSRKNTSITKNPTESVLSGFEVGDSGNKDSDIDVDKDDDGEPENKVGSTSETKPTPTVKPFPTLITISPVKPTTIPKTNIQITQFIYPGSNIVSQSNNNLDLISSDNPKTISEWYKAKIKELNMAVTTSVFTQANDKYLIKLSGTNGEYEVKGEVNKEGSGDSIIKVSID